MNVPSAIKPVFVVGGLYSLANGVAWIMRDLAAALGRQGSPVTVCAADCWGRGLPSIGHIFQEPTNWVSSRGLWMGGLSWAPGLQRRMSGVISHADVVHNHSVWMLPNSYGSRLGQRHHKPVVFTAHGALEPWALRNSGWKKRLVGNWFQDRDLRQADCIHVNSNAEVAGIREYGLDCPIAVVPNGINVSDFDQLPPLEDFESLFPAVTGKRIALYMARLHEKKGLGHLIPAWARVVSEHPDWHLVIAGPDRGYEATARQKVSQHQLEDQVTFVGPLLEEMKLAALAAADLFVQPSFSEGFSMSVLEALASRCPVLITPGCNFPEVGSEQAGVIVEPNVDSTASGLAHLMSLSDQQRTAMGARGRALVESRYTWDNVAGQMLELYRWLNTGGRAPEFVLS